MAGNIDMWWEKRALRSIDQLKLWQDNPRLDPAESHITLADFTEELISIPSDKQSFMELISSIADKGYLSFDPIVVWKDEQDRYVVAEGNRRVLAMKLLRNPSKSPRSIRKFVMQQAELIERDSIDKVRVCVAPSFEDCEWYILQRHSTSTIQRRWERLQQQRWIVSLCDKYSNNLEVIRSKTGFTRSEIEKTLRYVKLRDLSTRNEVVKLMDTQEKEIIYSHRIPMTIIERWFDSADVRDAWGLQYSGSDIKITSNESSFLFAYAKLLKRILNSDKYPDEVVINTRTVPEKNTEILKSLPAVLDSQDVVDPQDTSSEARGGADKPNTNDATKDTEANNVGDKEKTSSDKATEKKEINGNPDRNQMVSKSLSINVSSYKLAAIFKEFKELPVWKYKNIASGSLRVFLDLAVDEFIETQNLRSDVSKECKKRYEDVTLQQRLKFLVETHITDKKANKVIRELLQHSNQYSLDTLNNYIHGKEVHHVERRTLNKFWDMLVPLFVVLIDLKAK